MFLQMARKKSKPIKKKVSKTKKNSKRKPTKKKTTKKKTTLKKKFSSYSVPPKNRPRSVQPKTTLNSSKRPVDTLAISNQVLRNSKSEYAITPIKQDRSRKEKWKRFTTKAKKAGKGLVHVIEETGKIIDKAGALSEKAAPALTMMAVENPELPFLTWAAGAVDTAAGAHRAYHGLVEDSYKGYMKGDMNRSGFKQLTNNRKYQKMMADVGDEDVQMTVFNPQNLLPSPDDMIRDPLPIFPRAASQAELDVWDAL